MIKGGPKDYWRLDNDGDGFACDWNPNFYRNLRVIFRNMIFTILNKNELRILKKNYYFIGTKTDIKDGFIHLSKWTQIKGTIVIIEKDIFILKYF